MGVIGVLAALQARHRTGCASMSTSSMQDAQVSWLNYMATMPGFRAAAPARRAIRSSVHVPYGTFPVKDG
jgi:crotonobetainyl-CoA:carnitine CoA-transferase CaiB-like acyl-CoA transferase